MHKQEDDSQSAIEDLSVEEARESDVKGGSTRTAGIGILKSADGGRSWL